jgi:D-glycero-alpha-D-manno-heptose 1-phosphate guanylyltransferase
MKNTVIILAGGFGTRLREAVPHLPKPMAPVQGRPFLEILIRDLYRQGARKIILSLFHQADVITAFVRQCPFPADLVIQCEVEPAPLGTGGATLYASREIPATEPFFVCNGDSWVTEGIAHLMAPPGTPALGLVEVADISRYGSVVTDENQRVVAFSEKNGASKPGSINSGIYLLTRELFSRFPLGTPFSLERDIFPQLVQQKRLWGVSLGRDFIDIGVPEDYRRFCRWPEERPELFEKI